VRLLSKQLKRVAARAADEAVLEEKRKSTERRGKKAKKGAKKGKAEGNGKVQRAGKGASKESVQSVIANNLAYLQCM